MLKRTIVAGSLLASCIAHGAPPNVLSFGSHASDPIVACVEKALSATGGVTYPSNFCGPGTTFSAGVLDYAQVSGQPTSIISQAVSTSQAQTQTFNDTLTTTPNPNVPYTLLTASFSGYNLAIYDQNYYVTLVGNSQLFTTAFCPDGSGAIDLASYPPLVFSTILPVNGTGTGGSVAISPFTTQTCGYAAGIEFSMSQDYTVSGTKLLTNSPSAVTANLAGLYAVLKNNHPTWNWFDIKGAMRQTASNWATGWTVCSAQPTCLSSQAANGTSYGYGNVDYASATAVASTSAIYLQPPGMRVLNSSFHAVVTLYPFRQTRRDHEVVYSVSPGYVWPVKNEYTATDIAASGSTLLYTSNGTDIVPMFDYFPAVSGTVTLVAFTTDGLGNYSRIESFSEIQAALTAGVACFQH